MHHFFCDLSSDWRVVFKSSFWAFECGVFNKNIMGNWMQSAKLGEFCCLFFSLWIVCTLRTMHALNNLDTIFGSTGVEGKEVKEEYVSLYLQSRLNCDSLKWILALSWENQSLSNTIHVLCNRWRNSICGYYFCCTMFAKFGREFVTISPQAEAHTKSMWSVDSARNAVVNHSPDMWFLLLLLFLQLLTGI